MINSAGKNRVAKRKENPKFLPKNLKLAKAYPASVPVISFPTVTMIATIVLFKSNLTKGTVLIQWEKILAEKKIPI